MLQRVARVVEVAKNVFPWYDQVPQSFQSCLIRFMASVVHHSEWLKTKYPQHAVLDNYLFIEDEVLEELKGYLGDVHGNYFVRKGVSHRDKVSVFIYIFFISLMLMFH